MFIYLPFRATLASGLLLLVLTACVGIAPTGSSPVSATPIAELADSTTVTDTVVVESEATAATRLFVDDAGRAVEIPVSPQRVIVSDFAAELLAIGVTPIAVGPNDFKNLFIQAALAGVESIGDPPNVETIAMLAPDLIIFSTVHQQIYPEVIELLAEVAPVVLFSFEQDPIYSTFPKIADAVGKSANVQPWLAEYEAEQAAAQALVQPVLGEETVSIVRVEASRLRVYLNRNFGGYMLYTSLQATPPSTVAAEIEKNPYGSALQISLEVLSEYVGDHLFIIVRNEGDDQAEFQRIQELALWQNLPAVQNGNVYFLDTDRYYGVDVTLIRETMKETAAMLAEKAAP
ncbi:MAG: ABC transporter substrate-binding protein [Caldilineaceae bacterium]|nr:ABC transporter substrate-binding protein [Caldilineaceae bacterium]